jgi:hypothetical protein
VGVISTPMASLKRQKKKKNKGEESLTILAIQENQESKQQPLKSRKLNATPPGQISLQQKWNQIFSRNTSKNIETGQRKMNSRNGILSFSLEISRRQKFYYYKQRKWK